MAAKNKHLRFFCTECGAEYTQWQGKCRDCGQWNSIAKAPVAAVSNIADGTAVGRKLLGDAVEIFTPLGTVDFSQETRIPTSIGEFDRVIGGGIVPGGVTLISGDPGIGKSTLLLQIAIQLAQSKKTAYVSGEESVKQIQLRAQRLGSAAGVTDSLHLASHNDCDVILSGLDALKPDFVIIDSIQTLQSAEAHNSAGSIAQIRTVTQQLVHFAKSHNCALMIVGHVTKEGAIAGPRLLEHMVDTVLYLEGDKDQHYRLLRTIKNRFGATDEIGVFDIQPTGLQEVPNPSALFTTRTDGQKPREKIPGKAVCITCTGSRALLVDIQALVASSVYPMPKRTAVGFENSRLDMILAILENRAGYVFAGHDIYLNVAGGLKIREPAADLAAAFALVSALIGHPLADDIAFAGELGLSGEVRPVNLRDLRIREAKKLGFSRVILPQAGLQNNDSQDTTDEAIIDIATVANFSHLMKELT